MHVSVTEYCIVFNLAVGESRHLQWGPHADQLNCPVGDLIELKDEALVTSRFATGHAAQWTKH